MSGHSKWSQIKHKKAVTDAKKSQIFSKISRKIVVAATKGENPEMNSDLRVAIEKAKEANMPFDNIGRAIKKGSGGLEEGRRLENIRYEAYGPGGAAVIIEGITDNKNRTVAEIKHILLKHNAKLAEAGAVTWAFEHVQGKWQPKSAIELNKDDKEKLGNLLEELNNHDDVQEVFSNTNLNT
jgi:YebC/PmpR family DNA-binding regulatory protein